MFSFYNPKKAHHCAIPRLLSVKIRPGVSSLRRSEKINKKSHKKLYFTPLPRSPPWTDFYQIWKKYVPLVHVVNSDKLCVSLFKGFDFTGGQSFHFSHRKLTSPYNSAALRLWFMFGLLYCTKDFTRTNMLLQSSDWLNDSCLAFVCMHTVRSVLTSDCIMACAGQTRPTAL